MAFWRWTWVHEYGAGTLWQQVGNSFAGARTDHPPASISSEPPIQNYPAPTTRTSHLLPFPPLSSIAAMLNSKI